MITKPDWDKRTYSSITLPNQLQVLIISDPETEKSSCALDVHVGSFCDGQVHGLAHFCEHLLFMGTSKYPTENEYSQFLSSHGGSSNAFTSGEHTNYYFDVDYAHLKDAMDRFSQFFISPLFLEDCSDREMMAVDSEHKKNLQSDSWRVFQLEKDLSNPMHPFSGFGTGNLTTLMENPKKQNINIRNVLLEFYDRYYSSNLMKLVILGRESPATLEGWACEMFSSIKNKSIPVPTFPGHPLGPEQFKQVFVKPVKQIRSMSLTFPFPDLTKYYKTRPGHYISHLIGHEGKGSLLSLLKAKGLAQGLTAGARHGGIGFEFFVVTVELTEVGIEKYEDVVVHIFEYIEMLKRSGVKEWIFNECKSLADVSFKFKDKESPSNYTSRLSGNLQIYPLEDAISGPYLIEKFDKDIIEKLIQSLSPNSFRLLMQNPAFESSSWTKADWYGTEYQTSDFSAYLIDRLSTVTPHSDLFLPEPNAFIPSNLEVEVSNNEPKHPSIVLENSFIRLWHKKDTTFLTPKASVLLDFRTPLAYKDIRSCVLTRLYTDLLKDELKEFSYYAELAGLEYHLNNSPDGIALSISGFNDKINLLLDKILSIMKTATFTQSQFSRIKEKLVKSYQNWFLESPNSQAVFYVTLLFQDPLYHSEDKLVVLNDIELQHVLEFSKLLLSKMFIQGFVHGNMNINDAIKIGETAVNGLKFEELSLESRLDDVKTRFVQIGIFL